ncbi:MAG: LapA family protein [Brevibacterium yomogidense]|uniref:Putative membrane protein n=1 Tax=Brevibacterium yomogidense TaxID=946573 RepID=A0A1X6XLI8_9MICO|nr:lipopolysaccharide assembly protein LapA domain-containing protein [Brevibacterium yomogidense]SLN00026.1 Putative membrane protein [Brevibacterium yomogidense]
MTTNPDPREAQTTGTEGTGNLSDSLPAELLEPDAGQSVGGAHPDSAPAPADATAPAAAPAPTQQAPARTGESKAGRAQAEESKGGMSGGVWVSLILGAVITVLLLVFIIQNNTAAQFQYFGWNFSLPLGVAMLLAAIAGVLVAGIVGSVRIFVLSRRLKKVQKAIGG